MDRLAAKQAMISSLGIQPVQVAPVQPQAMVTVNGQTMTAPQAAQFITEGISNILHNNGIGQGRLDERHAINAKVKDYTQHADILRITRINCYKGMDALEREAYNQMRVQAAAYAEGFRFLDAQCEAIAAYQTNNGLFAPMGVGMGKTLTTLAIKSIAFARGIERSCLFIPPSVVFQLMNADIKWARTKININYQVYNLSGRSANDRKLLANSKKKGLYVFPYSLLSGRDAYELLEAIQPGLLIADEVHNLAKMTAARSRRVRDYIEKYLPQVCALSGTITSKSIMDYYHIIKWCLGEGNPLPNTTTVAQEWANVIDAEPGKQGDPSPGLTGALRPLVSWAQSNFPEQNVPLDLAGFRRAYKLRFTSVPGVVSTGDAGIGTSLILANLPVPDFKNQPGWEACAKLSSDVEDNWKTPNGDMIEHQIHFWKWLYELTSGFYNELTWPMPHDFAARHNKSVDESATILQRAKDHHTASQRYAKELRDFFKENAKPGLDTPLLVGSNMFQHGDRFVTKDLYAAWTDMRKVDFEGRPDRDSRAVRLCDYKIRHAIKWAQELPKGEGGVIWFHHNEIGNWLAEYALAAGLDFIHCPAGERFNQMILDHANGKKIIIASLTAHGTGKNLQHMWNQFFAQWPRPCVKAEQGLGRMHRTGQQQDEITAWLCNTTIFDHMVFAATLNDALYVQQTTGNRQKLLYAKYNPTPVIYSSAWLKERGLENKELSTQDQKKLNEQFGVD